MCIDYMTFVHILYFATYPPCPHHLHSIPPSQYCIRTRSEFTIERYRNFFITPYCDLVRIQMIDNDTSILINCLYHLLLLFSNGASNSFLKKNVIFLHIQKWKTFFVFGTENATVRKEVASNFFAF